ncbi:hypothetical protein O9992_14165 [Vibrio lentus]|nr:hypothetical protein [Vibrio lentus]
MAEYFRDQGLDVLLLMDSLTRLLRHNVRSLCRSVSRQQPKVSAICVCQASCAEIGKERVTVMMNRLYNTAFFTVLTEGDDLQDPIADASRAIWMVTLCCPREMADAGHLSCY